jgi:hypothetical protein
MKTELSEHDILVDRIGDRFNDWPDMAVVAISEVDPSDPIAMYHFGYIEGSATVYRQVRNERLPDDVAAKLKSWGTLYWLVQTRFTLAAARGQYDDLATRNILALIGPKRGYDHKDRKATFESPALIIELGCEHEYKVIHHMHCYTKSQCVHCANVVEVDTSD